MKILYHHRTRGRAVEAVHIMGIARALRELGHHVDLLSPPGVDIESSNKQNQKEKPKTANRWYNRMIHNDYFKVSFELKEHLYNLYAFLSLCKKFRNSPFDLIYERYALNCYAGVIFAKYKKIPIILEINDSTGIERVREHVFENLAAKIEKKILTSASYLITISSYFKEHLIKKGIEQDKIDVHPNAVELSLFSPELFDEAIKKKFKIGKNKIVIGYVGQFVHWHNVNYLMEIVPEIIKQFTNVHFILVGDGATFLECKEFIQKTKCQNYVTFAGRIEHSEIPKYLRIMDIGIIPNSNLYGSPVKLFEYMAMSCVPVVPRLKPMEDIITNGMNGIFFEPSNTSSMKNAIIGLLENDQKRRSIANNAKGTVLKKHLWKHNAEAVISIYEKIKKQ